jgi:hypothetical protein
LYDLRGITTFRPHVTGETIGELPFPFNQVLYTKGCIDISTVFHGA